MAWTEQCKIEAVAQINSRAEEYGSIRKACKEISEESGIPIRTLQDWACYPDGRPPVTEKSVNGKKKEKTPEQFWKLISRKLDKLVEDLEETEHEIPDEFKGEIYISSVNVKRILTEKLGILEEDK